jgi:hypothetical protein
MGRLLLDEGAGILRNGLPKCAGDHKEKYPQIVDYKWFAIFVTHELVKMERCKCSLCRG